MYVYVHISLFLPECACTTIIDISPRIFKLIYSCCVSIIIVICICPPGGKWNASSGKWKRHPTCPMGQVKIILWYVQFLKSKMINIKLFSVGSRGEFYLNNASYISCIFTPFCFTSERAIYGNHRICLTSPRIGTFPRFVAIEFYFLSETLI
jgi:hypothetical protein